LEELKRENLAERAHYVGDPMFDAFQYYRAEGKAPFPSALSTIDGGLITPESGYYYLTCHREENTKDDHSLAQILLAMESLPYPTYYPVHPRNLSAVMRLREQMKLSNVFFLKPLGYLESIAMVSHAQRIVTDSGGVQREAYFAKVPCVTVFDFVAWPETMHDHCNQLAKPEAEDILAKLKTKPKFDLQRSPFGDGHACEKVVSILNTYFG
jgi:UDP-N-acetylglucosamine 2-epimerase (non-hydrolysing)/UDP-GlcNAc3NAcA epimerase